MYTIDKIRSFDDLQWKRYRILVKCFSENQSLYLRVIRQIIVALSVSVGRISSIVCSLHRELNIPYNENIIYETELKGSTAD